MEWNEIGNKVFLYNHFSFLIMALLHFYSFFFLDFTEPISPPDDDTDPCVRPCTASVDGSAAEWMARGYGCTLPGLGRSWLS